VNNLPDYGIEVSKENLVTCRSDRFDLFSWLSLCLVGQI
jgi:hypothetical protein